MNDDLVGGIEFYLFLDLIEVEGVLGLIVAGVGAVEEAVFAELDLDEEDLLVTHRLLILLG